LATVFLSEKWLSEAYLSEFTIHPIFERTF
jgi:hypothetical protein